MSESNYVYLVYSSVFITKGVERSIILDVFRGKLFFIPNSLAEILEGRTFDYNYLFNSSLENPSEHQVIKEYFSFLIENELIFKLDKSRIKEFPPLDTSYQSSDTITNAIVDFVELGSNFSKIIEELENNKIKNIQLRLFFGVHNEMLIGIFDYLGKREFDSISLVLSNWQDTSKNDLVKIIDSYNYFNTIIIFNSDKNEVVNNNSGTRVVFSEEKVGEKPIVVV